MLAAATVADTIRDVASVVGAVVLLCGVAIGLWKFIRRIDRTLDDVRTHVIPHFRPATVEEVRAGDRAEGDTIPERVAVVERDLSAQTTALSDHLEAEMTESSAIRAEIKGTKDRLGNIEAHLDIVGGR